VPLEAGLVMPVFGLLIVAVFFGLVVLWRQAEMERHRLAAREQEERSPAGPPALRPGRAQAAGPASILRELARAADDRSGGSDARLVAPARPARPAKPVLTLVADTGPAHAPVPEPSLLPSMRKPSAEEVSRMRLVAQAFEADRLELHLQPIVSLPHSRIHFYEVLARLRLADGTLLAPAEFLPVLECSGRASDFDRRILARSMAIARHLLACGSEAIVGVNLCAHSIAEPGFLWSLVSVIDASPELLGKIVLELPQHSWRHLDAEHKAALTALRERGVPFSLDRAADLRFDPQALAELGVRFMKLPADLMNAAAQQVDGRYGGPERDVRDFASTLRRQGIRLIADRVDQEEMVPVLCDLGVPLAQGFVLAVPRPVKPEITHEQSLPQPQGLEEAPTRLRRAG